MTYQNRARSARYSRPPSLSTISSEVETNFSHRHQQQKDSAISPYIGNDHNRNSIVSPLFQDPTGPYLPAAAIEARRHVSSAQRFDSEGRQEQEHKLAAAAIPPSRDAHFETDNYRNFSDLERGRTRSRETFDIANNYLKRPEEAKTRSSSTSMSDTSSTINTVEAAAGVHAVKYMKTRYMWMLLQQDQIPQWHNILAAVSTWVILAAYLVVPGTFTSFKNSDSLSHASNDSETQLENIKNAITNSVDHVGLLALSGILAGVGSFTCIVLWIVHWKNYIWLCWKIFTPVTLNSFAGLLTTVVNVYTAQEGVWSITAKLNAIITGSVAVLALVVYCLYSFWLLEDVKKEHRKHFPVDAELIDPIKKRRALTRFEKIFPGE